LPELRDDAARQMIGAQGVLEAGMGGAGVNEKGVAELAHVAQSLYGRCVEERERLWLEADVVPERVANDLVRRTRGQRCAPTWGPCRRTARNSCGTGRRAAVPARRRRPHLSRSCADPAH